MSRKFLESDEVDSKIFYGRVLTLLGEILRALDNQSKFLESQFYMGDKESPAGYEYDPMDEGDEDD